MGFSEKELAQRLFCLYTLEAAKDATRREESLSGEDLLSLARAAISLATVFENVWVDKHKKEVKLPRMQQSQLEQFLQMLRNAKVAYDEPVVYGDGTQGVKIYVGYEYFPTFYFDMKSGNMVEVLLWILNISQVCRMKS